MGIMDSIMDSTATTLGLRDKPKPKPPVAPQQPPRVKTPAEYELLDAQRMKQTAAAMRQSDTQTRKLVPDDVFNYGEK